MYKFLIFLSCIFVLLSCGTVRVYEDPDNPVFISNDIPTMANDDSLVVLSFNVAKAEKIEQAILELKLFENKIPVDIYLLQEMDEAGVKSIANELHLNYLYIPNVYNELLKKNIGNAILAKGTFGSHKKLMLPNKKWINGRRRQVTVGEVNIRNKNILVYSVHCETSSMKRKKRIQQWGTILEDFRKQSSTHEYVIIGGDFNTLFSKDVELLVQKFDSAGLSWATKSCGQTAHALFGLVKPREDHIFSKGLHLISAGKIDSSKASDHFPVYAVFRDVVGK